MRSGSDLAARATRLLFVLASTVAWSMSATAAVQQTVRTESPLGSRVPSVAPARIPDRVGISGTDAARIVMIEYAQCVLGRHRGWVLTALSERLSPPGAPGKVGKLNIEECMGTNVARLKMRTELLRGAFYTALYRSDFAEPKAPPPPREIDFTFDVSGKTGDENQYLVMREFGKCVVANNATVVRSLILSQVASPQEQSAFSSLSPVFGDCAEKGISVKFSKTFLSGLLAEVLYRETVADGHMMASVH